MKKKCSLMVLASLVMLLFAFLVPQSNSIPVQAGSSQPPPLIRLHYATFDPLQAQPYVPLGLRARAASKKRVTTYIIQFTGPVSDIWKQAVERTGAQLYGYVPELAFIARMDAVTAERVAALSFVRWVGLYHPAYRLEESLREPHALSRAPTLLTVQTLPDADLDAVAGQVIAWGGDVQERVTNDVAGYVRMAITTDRLDDLASLEGVLWVEPYFEPELANDIGGGTVMRTNAVRTSLGLYGSGQIVAVADSGLDTGNLDTIHPDVKGRIIQTYALGRANDWSDPNGHGTHVAGSVLGNGITSGSISATHQYANSYAGTAPEARLVFQSLGDDQGGLGGIPADTGSLMRTAHTDGARVHTNSWGGPTGGTPQNPEYGGYTASSQQVDQALWEHKDMLTLFCAHNHGVDVDKDGVVDPDTVTQPGTAKNVLTVGASENDRNSIASTWGNTYAEPIASDKKADNPDGMASFSSRGPLDDGRVKPDISAPGTYIASLRTRQYVLNDDMETGSPADTYTKLTLNGGTGDSWQLLTDDPHSPTHYWKAVVNGTYNGNAMKLLLAPVANVRPVGGAFDLSFWHKYNLGGDNRLVLLLTDNDLAPQFWITLDHTGTQSSYQQFSKTIPTTLCDQQSQTCIDFSNFGVGFAIISQSGNYNSEWWLDDIRGDGADWGTMSSVGLAQPGDAVDEAYVMQGGTSMATPLTAGAAALVREWYNDQGVANPSGALLKATLINGAVDMSPGQYGTGAAQEIPTQRPNNVTGWGRVDLVETLDPPAPRTIWFTDTTTGLSTGGQVVYTLSVGPSQVSVQGNRGIGHVPAQGPLTFERVLGEMQPLTVAGFQGGRQVQGTSQVLQNAGFESGTWSPWQIYGYPSLVNDITYSGSWATHLGNTNLANDQIWQAVDIPADATGVTLDFWYRLITDETYTEADYFSAGIWDSSGLPVYVMRYADFGQTGDQEWTREAYSLSPTELVSVTGKTVHVGFFVQTDFSLASRAWVDDAALYITTTSSITATLAIVPESGPRGTTFTATGSDFNARDTVTLTRDGAFEGITTTNAGGSFSLEVTPAGTITKGSHTVTATDSAGHTAQDTFDIVPQVSVGVTPSSGQAGDVFTIVGNGFHGGSTITVTLDGSVDGITTAHASGAFTYTLTTDAGIAAGPHTAGAVDDEALTQGDTFTITSLTARQVKISPSQGPTGTTFTITGANFTASAVITLSVDGAFITTTTAGGDGAFNTTYTPTDLAVGQHTLLADDGDGQAQVIFTIVASAPRQVTISPSMGLTSTTFTITGTNFTASTVVTLTVDGAFIKTTSAGADGTFNTTYTPTGLGAGEHTLRADDGDGHAQTKFTITVPAQKGGPFRVTLAWTDYPAELSAAKALVNDLDLEVIDPNGVHYYGNQGLYTSGQCLREDKWDACNNVEGTVISDALHGVYTVIVRGYNVPQGPQPFALVASGDNVRAGGAPPPSSERQLSMAPSQGPNGTPFTITGTNFTASAIVTLTVDGGFIQTASANGSGGFTTVYTPTSLNAGQHTLVANDGDGQAQANFNITTTSARQVGVTPAAGPNGTTFTITGTHFTASAVVTLTVDSVFIKTASTDGNGGFTTTYTPTDLDVGERTLVASDGDGQAQTTFSIKAHSIYLPLVLRL